MPRNISTANLTELNADSLEEVWLVKMEFDDPLYANTHTIDIEYDGNTYVGFGDLGAIARLRESELLAPDPLQFTLSGLNAQLLTEALDATQYGATVTLYQGFLSQGELVDDPIEQWSGWAEFASVKHGDQNAISLNCQHDLADIEEADESRYSNEDQQANYAGDTAFQYIHAMSDLKLIWAGGPVDTFSTPRNRGPRDLGRK